MTITPELVTQHQLTQSEYSKIVTLLGREPSYTELGIFSALDIIYMFSPAVSISDNHFGSPQIKRTSIGIQPTDHVKPNGIHLKIFWFIHHPTTICEAYEQYGSPKIMKV